MPTPSRFRDRRGLSLSVAAIVALLLAAAGVRLLDGAPQQVAVRAPVVTAPFVDEVHASLPTESRTETAAPSIPASAVRIFGDRRFLVAYYGTAGTGALGVLGETTPDQMHQRLRRASGKFRRPSQPIQPVYELIVTIADAAPGHDGDYSHDIARADVARYVSAAKRNGALLLLDLQPGRSDFLEVARRWAWALRSPHVGLALDPEWRMATGEVPGRTIGSVDAAEINRVTSWLTTLQVRHGLPQKLFVLHQFRADMIDRIGSVQPRPNLAMVQHVDGFGTPSQKRATFDAVAQPQKFRMGFKLFYDEDVDRMGSSEVHELRPKVRFVSFQ
ncbi:MAG: hypothetical protein WB767_06705 [Nocardioides sp.]